MNKKELSRFKVNALYSAITLFLKLFINIVIFLIIARADFVRITDFGLLNYAIGLGVVFTLLADYGIETYAIRDIASGKIKRDSYCDIFSFRVFLSVFSFLLFLLYCLIVNIESFYFVLLIVLSFYFGLLSRTIQLFFQAQEKFHIETKARIFEDMMFLIFIFVNILYFKSFELFGILFFISRLIGFFYNYYLFKKIFEFNIEIRFDKRKIKTIFYDSFSFALLTILPTFMINLDTIMIKHLINKTLEFINSQIAYYSASVKLFVLFTFIASIFQKALLPQLSRLKEDKKLFLKSIYTLNNAMMNFNIISAIFIFIYAKDIVIFLYSDKYIQASLFVRLVAVIIFFRTSVAYGLYFTILDHLKVRIFSSSILLIFFLVFSLYFIPNYDGIGALYAIGLAYIVSWSYTLYQTYKINGNMFLGLNKTFLLTNGIVFFILLKFFKLNFFIAVFFTMFYLVSVFIVFRKRNMI